MDRRRLSVALLALAACGDDAAPAPDAPIGCPHAGTAPRFTGTPRAIAPGCTGYTFSFAAGLAMATCGGQISLGPLDGALAPTDIDPRYIAPRLAADGDAVLLEEIARTTPAPIEFFALARAAADWGAIAMLPLVGDDAFCCWGVGTPARTAAGGELFFLHGGPGIGGLQLVAGGTWSVVDAYAFAELEVGTLVAPPNIAADGLRAVLSAPGGIYYIDRATTRARFGAATLLDGVPADASAPALADDCSRIYITRGTDTLAIAR